MSPSLRTIGTLTMGTLLAVTTAATASLFSLSQRLRTSAAAMEDAEEGVRLAENVEVVLLSHNLASDRRTWSRTRGDLARELELARTFMDTTAERNMLSAVEETVEA